MTDSEYARHRKARGLYGGSRQAIAKARATGRLRASLGPDGQVADADLADREWRANTDPAKDPTLRPRSRARQASAGELAAIVKALEAAMREWAEYLAELATSQAPEVVAGVVAALREAGRPATAAAVRAALDLDEPEDSDPVAIATERILATLDDDDGVAAARAVGREAVLGIKEAARDGE